VYRHEEIAAKVGELPPVLRGLAEELVRRGEGFDHRIPVDEALDSDLAQQLRLALSVPAYKQEWIEFWQALGKACGEDIEAIKRGEHDHELY
jgi:hypothetical protein